jgi:ribosome-associated translation inhibitor RaiA
MRFTQINLRHMRHSEALTMRIREISEKLEEQHPRVMNIRVTVECVGNHQQKGRHYLASVVVHLPGREVVANRHEHEDVFVALRDAFDVITRQLEPQRAAA